MKYPSIPPNIIYNPVSKYDNLSSECSLSDDLFSRYEPLPQHDLARFSASFDPYKTHFKSQPDNSQEKLDSYTPLN